MEQHGYHLTDVREIWYLRIFRKSVEKSQVSLKSDWKKKFILFHCTTVHFDSLSFIHTNSSSRLHTVSITGILNICCHITTMDDNAF